MYELASVVVFVGAMALVLVASYFISIQVPADMARARNRRPLVWIPVSLLANPIIAILLLWIFGDAELEKQDET